MARRRMLAPINSVKHYVQRAITNVAVAGIVNEVVIDAVVATAVNLPNEVLEGAVIKAVFVEVWPTGIGAEASNSAFNITVEKVPAAAPLMTNAQSLNLMVYPNKKNILYTTQGVVNSEVGINPVPLLRQWITIPKGKQRFGLGDRLVVNYSSISSISYLICGIYVFKEYR